MQTIKIINTKTGEVMAQSVSYAAHNLRQDIDRMVAHFMADRRKVREQDAADKGHILKEFALKRSPDGTYQIDVTGDRFGFAFRSGPRRVDAGQECYDSRQRNGRGDWVGPWTR